MNRERDILKENECRKALYFRDYDRIKGDPESEVVERIKLKYDNQEFFIPSSMMNPLLEELNTCTVKDIITKYNKIYNESIERTFLQGFTRDRFKHDFEFWAFACVPIQDKLTKKSIPFKLNRGQRRLIHQFEKMRLSGIPIRVILVKARQWGGSTATQMYMLWLQLFHHENWHSAVVTQVKQQAANIRGMISKVVSSYPKEVDQIKFTGYENMQGIKYIPQRGCIVGIGSAENPDAFRSFDFSMLHLSEVGLWKSTPTKSGDDIAQSLYATVPETPGTLIVMESTAKGQGNFFHAQYIAAKNGLSELVPVFVPWFEIEMYNHYKKDQEGNIIHENGLPVSEIKDPAKFISSLTDYDKFQWEQGATLEGISWYRTNKRAKNYNDFQMKSEFPTTAEEAFQTNSARYYEEKYVQACRKTCKPPRWVGDIRGYANTGKEALKNIDFVEDGMGPLSVWEKPELTPGEKITHRYIVSVDIGGKHHKSDWSTINVFDRVMLSDPSGALERVATWKGHIDHDILAWKAAQVASWYDYALLVIESNTLETRDRKKDESIFEGDHFFTVLDEIANHYDNLYARETDPDKTIEGRPIKYGWHMNKRTKYLAYDRHRAAVRECEIIERDNRSVDEMGWLETKTDGTLGAISGEHDDIIDPTAVATYIALEEMPIPKLISTTNTTLKHRISKRTGGEATI